ncbi:MAG: hypothetical protein K2Q26_12615 [Bdellovibrionales bacterium]|nr:hypothetical protein [Bdellovibrionales bacterium]
MSFLEKFKNDPHLDVILVAILFVIVFWMSSTASAMNISGEDLSGDLETVGSLFKTADTITFAWLAPFAAGIFGIIGCIGLIRSHFVLFILGFAAVILILLVPKIVSEVRKKGGDSVLGAQVIFERKECRHV